MNTGSLIAAAVASLVTLLIHALLGERSVVRPFRETDLPLVPKMTMFYCWHMVTIALAAMTVGFLWAAWRDDASLAAFLTLLAAAFAVLNLALASQHKLGPRQLPQWSFFLIVTALGLSGLLL